MSRVAGCRNLSVQSRLRYHTHPQVRVAAVPSMPIRDKRGSTKARRYPAKSERLRIVSDKRSEVPVQKHVAGARAEKLHRGGGGGVHEKPEVSAGAERSASLEVGGLSH